MDNNASTSNFGLVDGQGEESWSYKDATEEAGGLLGWTRYRVNDWDEVHPRLLVGGILYSDRIIAKIIDSGITDIFDNCQEHYAQRWTLRDRLANHGVEYHFVGTHDDGQDKRKEPWMFRAIPKIVQAVRRPDSLVLTHCAAGYNRGPSLGIAALRGLGMTSTEARKAICDVRDVGLLYEREANVIYNHLKARGRV